MSVRAGTRDGDGMVGAAGGAGPAPVGSGCLLNSLCGTGPHGRHARGSYDGVSRGVTISGWRRARTRVKTDSGRVT